MLKNQAVIDCLIHGIIPVYGDDAHAKIEEKKHEYCPILLSNKYKKTVGSFNSLWEKYYIYYMKNYGEWSKKTQADIAKIVGKSLKWVWKSLAIWKEIEAQYGEINIYNDTTIPPRNSRKLKETENEQ